jgi:transcriptional regulator NrdR family protein
MKEQHQQLQSPATDGKKFRPSVQQQQLREKLQTGLSVQAPSSSVSDMLKIASVVQQIMTELNGALSEENKIVIITKMVLNLIKQNYHWIL